MTELCQLAQKYGTDKFPWYTPFYDLLLERRRFGVHKVLEIGIGSKAAMTHVPNYQPGASLRMWRDYFPSATIFGWDKDPGVLFHDEPRIETYGINQSNAQQMQIWMRGYLGQIDLIIDDGSHELQDQLLGLETLRLLLAKDGIHIVEDARPELIPHLTTNFQWVDCHAKGQDLVGHCLVIHAS